MSIYEECIRIYNESDFWNYYRGYYENPMKNDRQAQDFIEDMFMYG